MKPKTVIAMAVAGTFAICTGALAGGNSHSSVEVQTPSSVSESGPSMSEPTNFGGTSGLSAMGTLSHDSSLTSSTVDYWRMGEEPASVGSTSSEGGSGTIGFDASLGTSPD